MYDCIVIGGGHAGCEAALSTSRLGLKTLLVSALSGIVTFTAVNLLSSVTGITLSVNAWTLGSSAVFGMPGVLGLLILRMII